MEGLKPCGLTVIKINASKDGYVRLFDNISSLEDAHLLAQYAMTQKEDKELIAILPGWNKSIDKNNKEAYEQAKILAEKCKVEEN